jgi:hypothetical protein
MFIWDVNIMNEMFRLQSNLLLMRSYRNIYRSDVRIEYSDGGVRREFTILQIVMALLLGR